MILLITGASGSGKTTLAKALKEQKIAQVYFFDDIGVPMLDEMVAKYGSPEKWQERATHQLIDRLYMIGEDVILEGSFNPEFAVSKFKELNITNYQIICLDCDRKIREKRLIEERNQPELVTEDMESFAQVLKEKTLRIGGKVIDTSNKSISELMKEIKHDK